MRSLSLDKEQITESLLPDIEPTNSQKLGVTYLPSPTI